MTVGAVFIIMHVEGLLSIVAFAAEFSLGYLGHVDPACPMRHLENQVMAPTAIQAFSQHMFFMAEDHACGVFRTEGQITASDFVGVNFKRDHKIDQGHG
jgi:hypothetical protein